MRVSKGTYTKLLLFLAVVIWTSLLITYYVKDHGENTALSCFTTGLIPTALPNLLLILVAFWPGLMLLYKMLQGSEALISYCVKRHHSDRQKSEEWQQKLAVFDDHRSGTLFVVLGCIGFIALLAVTLTSLFHDSIHCKQQDLWVLTFALVAWALGIGFVLTIDLLESTIPKDTT